MNVVSSLRDKSQVEQLLRYIVENVPEDSEKKRSFKYDMDICCSLPCHMLNWFSDEPCRPSLVLILQVSIYCLWDFYLWNWHYLEDLGRRCWGKYIHLLTYFSGTFYCTDLWNMNPNNLHSFCSMTQLMDLLFSFVKPDHPHSTLLAGYFSKVNLTSTPPDLLIMDKLIFKTSAVF